MDCITLAAGAGSSGVRALRRTPLLGVLVAGVGLAGTLFASDAHAVCTPAGAWSAPTTCHDTLLEDGFQDCDVSDWTVDGDAGWGDAGWYVAETPNGRTTLGFGTAGPNNSWVGYQYPNDTLTSITSPTVTLPAGQPAWLTFVKRQQTRPDEDFVSLDIIADGTPYAVYTFAGQEWWDRPFQFDLTAFAGMDVAVRFRFESDNSFNDLGFFIDDVWVFSLPAECCFADIDCPSGTGCLNGSCEFCYSPLADSPTPGGDACTTPGYWEPFDDCSADGEWTFGDSGTGTSWQTVSYRRGPPSQRSSLYVGEPTGPPTWQYTASSDAWARTPAIALPTAGASQVVEVTFRRWMQIEPGDDLFSVELYVPGTGQTHVLAQDTGFVSYWATMTYDLTAWAGQTVHLQFRLTSDATTNYEGVYIDSVMTQLRDTDCCVYDSQCDDGISCTSNDCDNNQCVFGPCTFCDQDEPNVYPDPTPCSYTHWFDGFESCDSETTWTIVDNTAGVGSTWWVQSGPDDGGHNSLYCGDPGLTPDQYANGTDAWATSPLITLPTPTNGDPIWLKFSANVNTRVEDVLALDLIDLTAATDTTIWFDSDDSGWDDIALDITARAGHDVRFRFRFLADAAYTDNGPYIDNFAVVVGPDIDGCCDVDDDCADGELACEVGVCPVATGLCEIDTSTCVSQCTDGLPGSTLPPGACGDLVWMTDFEDCATEADWDLEADDGSGWHFTDNRAQTAPNALYCGDPDTNQYTNNVDADAKSPWITLPVAVPGQRLYLSFDLWGQVATSSDRLRVYVDTAGGSSQRAIYYGTAGWETKTLDIHSWQGQAIRIRFRFESNSSNVDEGFYIDNLAITNRAQEVCCATAASCVDGVTCTPDTCGSGGQCEYPTDSCPAYCDQTIPNFLIVLDRSASMDGDSGNGQSKWTVTIEALEQALATHGQQLHLGLKLFPSPGQGDCGVHFTPELNFGSTPFEIISTLYNTAPGGSTPMGAALQRARNMYSWGSIGIDHSMPKYVLLVTDGRETCNGFPEWEIDQLAALGIGTFVLGFGDGIDEDVLNAMAVNGGYGQASPPNFYSASNDGDLQDAFDSILQAATDEICDGQDNDCDGDIDENVTPLTCTHPTCGQGVRYCMNGAYGDCELDVQAEVCNGLDDNCNLIIDDPWTDLDGPVLGQVCVVGAGACEAAGTVVCPADQVSEAECDGTPGDPTAETCNAVDDDCDGFTDNATTGDPAPLAQSCFDGPGTVGVGECQAGTSTCSGGGYGACQGQVVAVVEVCNGLDDDCDGETDELGQCCATTDDCTEPCDICVANTCQNDPTCVACEVTRPRVLLLFDHSLAMLQNAGGMSRWEATALATADFMTTPGAEEYDVALKLLPSVGGPACAVHGAADVDFGDPALLPWLALQWPMFAAPPLSAALATVPGVYGGAADIPPGTEHVILVTSGTLGCGDDGLAVLQTLIDLNTAGIYASVMSWDDSNAEWLGWWHWAGGLGDIVPATAAFWHVTSPQTLTEAMLEVVHGVEPELCNHIDDDCNEAVDDGVTARTCVRTCTGTLVRGHRTCGGGTYGSCVIDDTTETCDATDNDCNGTIDDPWAGSLGQGCTVGIGACAVAGSVVCNAAGDGTVCDAQAGTGSVEVCDGIDNDCDGETDEDGAGEPLSQSCYTGAPGTLGTGACQAGVSTCQGGGWSGCVGEVTPSGELCNDVDDDCNGGTDEPWVSGFLGGPLGDPCLVGLGECALTGVFQCPASGVGLTECFTGVPEPTPTPEVCDGLDNDCDGLTDEDPANWALPLSEACYGGGAGTAGVGECQAGLRYCIGGNFGGCGGQVLPQAEDCDGLDNDCDTYTDETDADPAVTLVATCYEGPPGTANVGECASGTRQCLGVAGWAPDCDGDATPTTELCNGLDDNCNGVTDDPWLNGTHGDVLGEPCTEGLGVCETDGVVVCPPSGVGPPVCDAVPPTGSAEVCDGLDNDCDGLVDENAVNQLLSQVCYPDDPSATLGWCSAGAQYCDEGAWSACLGAEPATPEVCDGADNDCDGFTDESDADPLLPYQESCYDGPGGSAGVGQCVAGVRTCVGGNLSGCVGQVVPVAELCDGLDNDCDGLTDESPADGPIWVASCYGGLPQYAGVGECSHGSAQCVSGEWGACVGWAGPTAEICDGLDNDCDGVHDLQEPNVPGDGQTGPCETLPKCSTGTCYCVASTVAPGGWECILE